MENIKDFRVLLCDSNLIVRKGIRQILEEQYADIYIEEVGSSTDLLNKLENNKWSILICELAIPDLSGLTLVKRVKAISPETSVLILSQHPVSKYSLRLLKVGASSYLTNKIAAEELAWAVNALQSGRMYLSDELVDLLADSFDDNSNGESYKTLSDNEFEILWHFSKGKSLTEISGILDLSRNTISVSKSRILKKMRLDSDNDLLDYSLRHGLFAPKIKGLKFRAFADKQEVYS